MFELHKKLETEIKVKDEYYQINLSFNNIMQLLDLINDKSRSDDEKIYYGIYILLGCVLDLEIEEQVKLFETLIETFIHSDDEIDIPVDLEGNVMPSVERKKSYDLVHDASYIYTSFWQAYHIDLFDEQDKLDWRKFKALLRDLPDDTKFKQIIDIRTRPYPKGKGMGEERKRLKDLKRAFALPDSFVED